MSRLYDRIIVTLPPLKDVFENATVIVIDNVADYFMEHWRAGRYKHADAERTIYPNIAPPFGCYFMEFHMPEYSRVGVLTVVGDKRIDGWEVKAVAFSDATTPPLLVAKISYVVDPNGSIVGDSLMCKLLAQCPGENDPESAIVWGFLYPTWLATSFMHCKNVTLTAVDPPKKLNRARVKRGKKPLVRYHTLNIEPMKQVLKHEGQIEKTGLKQALHICRGHFKDYRQRGLFGHNKGLYWWDSHVRGSIDEGVVGKDYNVKAPK